MVDFEGEVVGITVKFVTGKELPAIFDELSSKSTELDIAIAYFSQRGYEAIANSLRQFILHKGGSLRLLVGLSRYYLTDPQPLTDLVKLGKQAPNQVHMKYVTSNNFHAKLMIFDSPISHSIVLGSSNLTGGGLEKNIEANFLLTCDEKIDRQIEAAKDFFDKLWKTKANGPKILTQKGIDEYAAEKDEYERMSNNVELKRRLQDSHIEDKGSESKRPGKIPFTLYLNGRETKVEELFAECTNCGAMTQIRETWATYWHHSECGKGKDYFVAPNPRNKPVNIKMLLNDRTRYVNGTIGIQCTRCKDEIETTTDFYWLVCEDCYNTLPRNKRHKIQW